MKFDSVEVDRKLIKNMKRVIRFAKKNGAVYAGEYVDWRLQELPEVRCNWGWSHELVVVVQFRWNGDINNVTLQAQRGDDDLGYFSNFSKFTFVRDLQQIHNDSWSSGRRDFVKFYRDLFSRMPDFLNYWQYESIYLLLDKVGKLERELEDMKNKGNGWA